MSKSISLMPRITKNICYYDLINLYYIVKHNKKQTKPFLKKTKKINNLFIIFWLALNYIYSSYLITYIYKHIYDSFGESVGAEDGTLLGGLSVGI